jgi:hypothetical protein
MAVLRYLDLVVLAIALPIFVVAGLPLGGYAVAAAAWLAQRAIQAYTTRRARASLDARTTVGLMAGSMIGRGWLVALSIFAVGVGDNRAGLAAAVLCIAVFTVYFTVNMLLRPFQDAPVAQGASAPSAPNAPNAPSTPRAPSTPLAPRKPLEPKGGAG